MSRYCVFAILVVGLQDSLGVAQEATPVQRFVFEPTAKEGDCFVSKNETRQTMKAFRGKETLLGTEQTDWRVVEATVVNVDRVGKPQVYRERTTRHDRDRKTVSSASLSSPADVTVGPFQDVELEYALHNGRYTPSRRAGESSKELEFKLKSPRISVLDEELLPTVPLAVGETQTISDSKRLKQVFHEFGPETTFLRPLKITLANVQKVDGTNYAMLRETVRLKTIMPIEAGAEVAVVLDVELTVAYDLDQGYLRQAKVRSTGTGKLGAAGQNFDLKLTYAADTQTIKRTPGVARVHHHPSDK